MDHHYQSGNSGDETKEVCDMNLSQFFKPYFKNKRRSQGRNNSMVIANFPKRYIKRKETKIQQMSNLYQAKEMISKFRKSGRGSTRSGDNNEEYNDVSALKEIK